MQTTRALIHRDNLVHNISQVRSLLGPSVALCASVKANAYGHGVLILADAARRAGVEALGVANVTEGAFLRESGIGGPIYVYGNPLPGEMTQAVNGDLIPFLGDAESVRQLAVQARRRGSPAGLVLKIDTGMGRIGCDPADAADLGELIARDDYLKLDGTCTHFAGSDLADPAFTLNQLSIFNRCITNIRDRGVDPGLLHAANSGGVIGFPEAVFDMVRVGIALYGYFPSDEQPRGLDLKPVMELQSRVTFLKRVPAGTAISYGMTYRTSRETVIATVPVGYGDGYSRLLSNRGEVLIAGKRYPIAGRVCMDQTMIDLGTDTGVQIGDPVTLFGPQAGAPDAEEIARIMGTIPYEVTCLIAHRVPRVPMD